MESKNPNNSPIHVTTEIEQSPASRISVSVENINHRTSMDYSTRKRISKVNHLSISSPLMARRRSLKAVNEKDYHFFSHMNHQYQEVSLHVRAGLLSVKRFASYIEKFCNKGGDPIDAQQIARNQRRKSDSLNAGTDLCEDLMTSQRLAESFVCNSFTYHAAFIRTTKNIAPPLRKFYKEKMAELTELDQRHQSDLEKMQKIRKKIDSHREKRKKEINELRQAWNKKKAGKKMIFDSYNRKREAVRKQLGNYEVEWAEAIGEDCKYTQSLDDYLGQMENIEKARIQTMQDALERLNKASLDLANATKTEADEFELTVKRLSVGGSLAQMLDTWDSQFGSPPEHDQIPYGLSCQAQDLDKGGFDEIEIRQSEQKMTEPVFDITVVNANNLRAADANGKSDPYCKVIVIDPTKTNAKKAKGTKSSEILASAQTEIIFHTLSPNWNKAFKFNEPSILKAISGNKWQNIVIRFEVWDHDTIGGHDFLGECMMKAGQDFLLGEVKTKTIPLSSNKEKAKENATGSIGVIIHMENVDYLHDKGQFQFGRAISDINTIKIEPYSAEIPEVLYLMQQHIVQNNGLNIEGIFRLAPDGAERDLVKNQLNRGLNIECEDACVMADLIKVWFRDQPNKLFTPAQLTSDYKEPEKIQSLFDSLEDPNLSVFKWLIDLCVVVVKNKEKNKMSAKNLGIVIGPNLIPETENLMEQSALVKGASSLVENSIIFFS